MRFRITFEVTTRANQDGPARREQVSLFITAGSRAQAIADTKHSVHRNPDQRFRLIECISLIEHTARKLRRRGAGMEARA